MSLSHLLRYVIITTYVVLLSGGTALGQTTFEVRVATGTDDAEEDSIDGSMYLDSSDLELAIATEPTDTVGMRFTAVTVPQGATISNAYVQFKCDETGSGAISLTIRGEDIDDAPTFTLTSGDITSRTTTTASIGWSPPDWNTVGEAGVNQRTSDISSIIQEIMGRPGWSSGNNLAIIITGTGTRWAESYDGDSAGAPLLHVEYDTGPPPPATTYYARPDGSDINSGTGPGAGEAWQTITNAVRDSPILPGDTVYVMTGTYNESVMPNEDGSSGSPIRVIADTNGSIFGIGGDATIQAPSGTEALDLDGDDYLEFVGFNIDGDSSQDTVNLQDCLGILLDRCEIYGSGNGQGVQLKGTSSVTIINCLIRDNFDDGIDVAEGIGATVWNTTIVNNGDDGMIARGTTSSITNSIIAFNGDDGLQIGAGTFNHSYNIVHGQVGDNYAGGLSQGTGESTADPLFIDPATNDYHLPEESPGVNTGTDAAGTVDDDLEGKPRPIYSAWDMGCYEGAYSGNLLFVVADTSSLTDQELARWTLISSWGYAITTIDDDDTQTNYDTAVAANDVAYISEEIISSSLDTKLRNANIGVVSEDIEASDEFGISSSRGWGSNTYLDVVEGTHYITREFGVGSVQIFSYSTSDTYVSGTLASDLHVLGQWGSSKSLVVVEAGGRLCNELAGSKIAAGRRVQLPWGGSSFEIESLTDDGKILLRRSIEWAAALVGHWKFDETIGATFTDSSSLQNHGSLDGGGTWTDGILTGAVDFDGVGDYGITDSNFTPPTEGTVIFWMQVPGAPASHGRVLGLADGWEIRHVTTGTADGIPYGLVFDLGVSGVNTLFATSSTFEVPGTWYHIAATYNTADDTYAVYVNGALEASGTYSSSLSVPAANRLSFGTRTGSTNYWAGTLDDLRVYKYAMSEDEINYLKGVGRKMRLRITSWREIPKPGG